MRVSLTRRYSLPALHVLSGKGFTEAENRRIFGGCSSLHGHEYLIEVTISGSPDPTSGWLISRDELDHIVNGSLVKRYAGSNLSDHFPQTTGEALACAFFSVLAAEIGPQARVETVTVRETAKNSFICESAH